MGVKYFRWEILKLIGIHKIDDNKISIAASANLHSTEKAEDYLPKSSVYLNISPALQPFSDEVKAYLNQTENNISKHELMDALQQLIEKYPAAQNVEYRNELTYFIALSVNAKHPQLLRTSDISRLWN